MAQALTVETAEIRFAQSSQPAVVITATGTVPSAGWTHPVLLPHLCIAPPVDGIFGFDLAATPPTHMSERVVSPIAVSLAVPNSPDWLKGVRIHASENSLVAVLADAPAIELTQGALRRAWEGELPWPDVFDATCTTIAGHG